MLVALLEELWISLAAAWGTACAVARCLHRRKRGALYRAQRSRAGTVVLFGTLPLYELSAACRSLAASYPSWI